MKNETSTPEFDMERLTALSKEISEWLGTEQVSSITPQLYEKMVSNYPTALYNNFMKTRRDYCETYGLEFSETEARQKLGRIMVMEQASKEMMEEIGNRLTTALSSLKLNEETTEGAATRLN